MSDELAAAEEEVRQFSKNNGWIAGKRVMAEYERRGEALRAAEFAASYQAATIARLRGDRDALQVDLARALPVVEAAGAVMRHVEANQFSYDLTGGTGERLLDALAAAVRAAREPRTGEQK